MADTDPTLKTEACEHDHTTCDACGMGFTAMSPPIEAEARGELDVAVLAKALDAVKRHGGSYVDADHLRWYADAIARNYAALAALAIEAEARAGMHPDDGYAYEGCNGPACRAARQEAAPTTWTSAVSPPPSSPGSGRGQSRD